MTIAFTSELASRLARLPLAYVHREYPHKLDHVMMHDADVGTPSELHPAFYGCFDWHSAVHGHWTLATILRRFPELPEAGAIRAALATSLTAENLALEAAYFRAPQRPSFERTYGWAWLLELARALHGWDDPDAARWAAALQPLVDAIVARWRAFLPRQAYPIRTGVHPNTAFGLGFALDHARATGDTAFAASIDQRARAYFAHDRDAPLAWEPGGEDFLSPVLVEADLMRRLLPPAELAAWLAAFAPGLPAARHLLEPVDVSDRSDPKLAHLDGLNLSRAWCLRALAAALPGGDALRAPLAAAAEAHARAGLAHVATGDYAGEHWLASFAVYLLAVPTP